VFTGACDDTEAGKTRKDFNLRNCVYFKKAMQKPVEQIGLQKFQIEARHTVNTKCLKEASEVLLVTLIVE